MTAFNPNFLTPSDQRALERIRRSNDPEFLGIMNSLLGVNLQKAAHAYASKMINLKTLGFQVDKAKAEILNAKEQLNVRKERTVSGETQRMADIESRKGISERGMESGRAISIEGMESGARRSADESASTKALKERSLEKEEDALPYEIGIGAARVGVGYMTGEAERLKEKRRIDLYNEMINQQKWGGSSPYENDDFEDIFQRGD